MDYLSALGLGMALAMDAMAVSVACGMANREHQKNHAVQTAFLFGLFQMAMPILGWSIGKVGGGMIDSFDNIIAFGILVFLGLKMLRDAKSQDFVSMPLNGIRDMLVTAAATSVDAMASGVVLPVSVKAVSAVQMLEAVTMIGIVTFVLSLAGYAAGRQLSRIKPRYAGMAGGIVLILIGIKTLITG